MMPASHLPPWMRTVAVACLRLHRDDLGASAIEYMMILAGVVIPIGVLLWTVFIPMIVTYSTRINSMIGLPFP